MEYNSWSCVKVIIVVYTKVYKTCDVPDGDGRWWKGFKAILLTGEKYNVCSLFTLLLTTYQRKIQTERRWGFNVGNRFINGWKMCRVTNRSRANECTSWVFFCISSPQILPVVGLPRWQDSQWLQKPYISQIQITLPNPPSPHPPCVIYMLATDVKVNPQYLFTQHTKIKWSTFLRVLYNRQGDIRRILIQIFSTFYIRFYCLISSKHLYEQ